MSLAKLQVVAFTEKVLEPHQRRQDLPPKIDAQPRHRFETLIASSNRSENKCCVSLVPAPSLAALMQSADNWILVIRRRLIVLLQLRPRKLRAWPTSQPLWLSCPDL